MVRARVEHVFAQQRNRLVQTIGLAGAEMKVGLMNIVYNMRRSMWLAGQEAGGGLPAKKYTTVLLLPGSPSWTCYLGKSESCLLGRVF
tara:strand:- start:24047 stop:24310 length:264 start_codon:yes stop_codon:yes gene_type:complete